MIHFAGTLFLCKEPSYYFCKVRDFTFRFKLADLFFLCHEAKRLANFQFVILSQRSRLTKEKKKREPLTLLKKSSRKISADPLKIRLMKKTQRIENPSDGGKPFLKWVGGKTQLLGEIFQTIPQSFWVRENVTYVEPFVGGGAVLFRFLREFSNISRAVINDVNPALIAAYRCVQSNPEKLIFELSGIEREYFSLPESEDARREFFLERRAEFNGVASNRDRKDGAEDIRVAALLIFLNRTCFNGLFRVNARGEFNVPFGKYTHPKICDAETIRADSTLLQRTEILCGDFESTLKYADGNALFYLDPPYKPISVTSSFNAYAQGGFGDTDQVRLRDFCGALHACSAHWVLSNSDAYNAGGMSFFEELYAGFSIRRVLASRMVNANASKRGKLAEVLISNFTKEEIRND